MPNSRAPVRPERSAKPVLRSCVSRISQSQPCFNFQSFHAEVTMMEAIAEDSPVNDVDGDISSSRDQDAKAERRRQQNRRNAQAWSKWPQSLCTRRPTLFFLSDGSQGIDNG